MAMVIVHGESLGMGMKSYIWDPRIRMLSNFSIRWMFSKSSKKIEKYWIDLYNFRHIDQSHTYIIYLIH